MDVKALEDIGLTQGEIKVYLALLELGSSSAGSVLEKAGIQNSVFHFCVNSLIEKGLVSYVKKNKFRIYTAADPENFKTYLKDKERQISQLLPELKAKQASAREKQEVELFEGIKGVITSLNEFIEGVKKGDEFLFFSAEAESEERSKEIQEFYESYDMKRVDKGLIIKGIAPRGLKSSFEKRKYLKMRYTQMPLPGNIGICNDRLILVSWEGKPTSVIITSKYLAKKQQDFFNALWKLDKS